MDLIIQRLARFKLRFERGSSLVGVVKNFVTVAIFLKVYGFADWIIIPVSIFGSFALYFLGYLDETKFKMWLYENEYSTAQLNPYFKKLKARLK